MIALLRCVFCGDLASEGDSDYPLCKAHYELERSATS